MAKAKFIIQNEEAYYEEAGYSLDDDLRGAVDTFGDDASYIKEESKIPGWLDIFVEGPDRDTVTNVIAGFFSVHPWAVGEGGTFDIQIEWV